MTELALIKLTRPEVSSDAEALAARMGRLERRLDSLTQEPPPARAAEGPASAQAGDAPTPVEAPEPASAVSPAAPEMPGDGEAPEGTKDGEKDEPDKPGHSVSFESLSAVWPGLFGSLRDVLGPRRWALFREVIPAAVEGATLVLHVPHVFHLEALQTDPAVSKVVATKAGDLLGTPVSVEFRSLGGGDPTSLVEVDLASEQLFEAPEESDPTQLLAQELGAELIEEVEESTG